MARFFLLIFVALFVVHSSLEKPSGGRSRHRLHDDDIEKIMKRCKEDPSLCKGQKKEHKKKRHGIKNAILNSLKSGGKSHGDAEKEAEEQLQKIHELKVKIHEAMGIPEVEPADDGLYGGDMVLSKKRAQQLIDSLQETESKSKRAADFWVMSPDDKWPLPIHYWINSSAGWSDKDKALIRDAINTLSYNFTSACLSFVEDAAPAKGSQIQFINAFNECSSIAGHNGPDAPNIVNLGGGWRCMNKGIIMHEIIHVLGAYHEHQRTDRDKYITIVKENIHPRYINQFDIVWGSTSYGFPYRTNSIMHYASDAFTMNGLPTMIKKGTNQPIIGDNEVLTLDDINQLNRMYCRLNDQCLDKSAGCGDDALAGKCSSSDTLSKCPMSCNQCGLRLVYY